MKAHTLDCCRETSEKGFRTVGLPRRRRLEKVLEDSVAAAILREEEQLRLQRGFYCRD